MIEALRTRIRDGVSNLGIGSLTPDLLDRSVDAALDFANDNLPPSEYAFTVVSDGHEHTVTSGGVYSVFALDVATRYGVDPNRRMWSTVTPIDHTSFLTREYLTADEDVLLSVRLRNTIAGHRGETETTVDEIYLGALANVAISNILAHIANELILQNASRAARGGVDQMSSDRSGVLLRLAGDYEEKALDEVIGASRTNIVWDMLP
jgi:hypothetical protein